MIRSGILLMTGFLVSLAALAQEPALIPMPSKFEKSKGFVSLKSLRNIYVGDSSLLSLGRGLKDSLAKYGIHPAVRSGLQGASNNIELVVQPPSKSDKTGEAYELQVTDKYIRITGASDTGVYYGIKTLMQLLQKDGRIPACKIEDQPAFAWRGFLVDVGRNYQTVELLKAQIDRMAQYKLNTFHFHVTEDIAWRLEVDGFPALTADSTMLRDPGMYYSKEEVLELMQYCKDRYIKFLLEVDMPGHSAAFERAMGVSMQSAEGMRIVQEIIRKIAAMYPIEYLHIGGDEVKITNQDFLPTMAKLVDSLGIRSVGWSPGGNIPKNTIRQLWMGSAPIEPGMEHIDSRHLYLNHMDPLEAVVTIFHRQIGRRTKGDAEMLGAIICVWNDRRLVNENFHLALNGVYPSMLAFAERSWRGGGLPMWTTIIGAPGSPEAEQFREFENRLLKHKEQYFKGESFTYYKQADQKWKLYGPYNNEGNTGRAFDPEFKIDELKPAKEVLGGTIWLRHWWAPEILGHIDEPKENTTWYAQTKIWANEDGWKDCWIGFNNFSRSMNTRAPEAAQWDSRGSVIWVNGQPIQAPNWKRAGKQVTLETPLTDEDYYYRKPTRIYFRKGWNTVLIKAPVASFKGTDWQNPVKWMFTFMVVE
ncbi:MAG TPA: beta-N-acetylhexosaminidase [Flavihumibacter sp.]